MLHDSPFLFDADFVYDTVVLPHFFGTSHGHSHSLLAFSHLAETFVQCWRPIHSVDCVKFRILYTSIQAYDEIALINDKLPAVIMYHCMQVMKCMFYNLFEHT